MSAGFPGIAASCSIVDLCGGCCVGVDRGAPVSLLSPFCYSPEGTSPRPDPFSPATVQPVHKWPLRPGVHVHVNSLTSLTDDCKPLHNNNTVTTLSPPSTQAPPPPHHSLPHHHLNHHANHLANPYHQQQLQKHQYSNNHSNHKGNSHHLKHSHALQPHQQYPTLENKRSGSSSHRKFKTNSQTLPRQTSTDIPKREERSPSSLSHSPASNPSPHPHPQPNSPATNTNNSKNKAKNCDLDANYHTGNSARPKTSSLEVTLIGNRLAASMVLVFASPAPPPRLTTCTAVPPITEVLSTKLTNENQ
ncbi:hypothetical protein E2C01_013412 [Portunus trituberculatus]|uniref:Uncharacterized protein n=1 Tax=Portunus trituberculatus TaxID=210409 RepID=A0A5B7DGK1_PORTR|nr:hypothetical protein [Portunus trituberculatus]